ncbi:DUF5999 family protein [Actinoplanes sp. M2I2]|uniref:DUF5999 family protein n=1 Tax=Actinoplanes sp. M2I2 TaxID=1734444 RepID=UPI00202248AE|nr:DUF5999 family protein [Actinoplanes sp. M2I2]
MCNHTPECPAIDQPGWDTAAPLVQHEDLGWSMLCNGAVVVGALARPAPAPAPAEMPARPRRPRVRTRSAAPTGRRTAQPLAA